MVVRTISQLPKADYNDIARSPENTYVEISMPLESSSTGDKYVSRKTPITEINKKSMADLSAQMVADHYLRWGSTNGAIRLGDVAVYGSATRTSDVTFSGIKTFTQFPKVIGDFPEKNTSYPDLGQVIPNYKKVKEMVEDTPAFMSTTGSRVSDGVPFKTYKGAATDYTGSSICYREFQDTTNFYYWKIADGKKDSSETVYDNTDGSFKQFVEIRETGYLVVWGWITDGGAVAADMSWVGLFARMKFEGDDTAYANIPLQIQPWIQGTKSSDMQYVGFGIPVRQGLQLNIRTGFPVVGGSNGAFQRPGSLTFQDGWIANSFVGYVIKNQE